MARMALISLSLSWWTPPADEGTIELFDNEEETSAAAAAAAATNEGAFAAAADEDEDEDVVIPDEDGLCIC